MENNNSCKYSHLPFANCHKDFCYCVKLGNVVRKKEKRDNAVKASFNFFEKHKIDYNVGPTENIVTTQYWGKEIYISLKSFKMRISGTNNWIDKNRSSMLGPNSKLKFGKHKGKKCSEVDKGYLIWLFNNTQYLIKRELIPEGI
jgi:hypothetical protein